MGHAEDFAALLEASDPFIQPDELLVGSCLAVPEDGDSIDLGYYNSHYPPGYATLLRKGLSGIRDEARDRLRTEADAGKREFLRAVEISYRAACGYIEKYVELACEMAALEAHTRRKAELERVGRELVQPMIAEAQKSLDEHVVETADLVDAGVIFGTGFAPFRGGPLHYQATHGGGAPERAAAE